MAEDLSKLSSADIRRFEKAVEESKALTARQEEIAKNVIIAEEKIGKIRLASLNEYFDAYSKGLDSIIARKTSQLNDAFLVMEQKALESFKRLDRLVPNDTNTQNVPEQPDQPARNVNNTSTPPAAANSSTDASTGSSQSSSATADNNGGGNYNGGNNNVGGGQPNSGGRGRPVKVTSQTTDDSNLPEDADEVNAEDFAEKFRKFDILRKTAEEQLKDITDTEKASIIEIADLQALQAEQHQKHQEDYLDRAKEAANAYTALSLARLHADEKSAEGQAFLQDRLKEIQLDRIQEVTDAELKAQTYINDLVAERAFEATPEAVEAQRQKLAAAERGKSAKELEDQRLKYIEQEERKFRRKKKQELTAEEKAAIIKDANEKYKLDEENLKKLTEKRAQLEAQERAKATSDEAKADFNNLLHGKTWEERKEAWEKLTTDETGDKDNSKLFGAAVGAMVNALSNFAQKLNNTIDEIGSYKSAIDTRLQGSSNATSGGSYWDQIIKDMTSVGAVNPYFRQSDFANNIKSLVERGIAFDLEQRAFLMTIQSKIANTFDVADGTLLKLIRIQQEDTTAGRLGMEAALNAFLNNMYENTEYLQQVADSVRGSLTEMQSLMSGAQAAEVEYQVQKWLGSLYSVGMSDAAVNSISTALGQIAAGQIEGLTGNGAGNLLIMAANNAGISITDILTSGINSNETNKLMQAIVDYLADIAESTEGNNVIQQQLADVFGVKASDLRAATNLVSKNSISNIFDNSYTYDNMLSYMISMASTMGDRTSISEMMTNIFENVQYSMAGSMASNPATYFLYKVASVLDDTVGGIPIPDISVFGSGVALNTTVADLLRVGSMAGGIIGSFGDLMSGLSNSFSGQAMLGQLGITSDAGIAVTPRGDGSFLLSKGGGSTSTSGSGYVGNASGSDIKNSVMQDAKDSKKQLMVEAQEEEEANQINVLNATVLKIYELLDDVAHGNGYFRVKVENYGLTKTGTGAQGGVSSLGGNNASVSGSGSSSGSNLSGGGVNSGGIGGSVDFGGWTTIV